ncbi:TPA: hypothetical protein ACH3X2_000593 [Trebouxia sp. C0005]
MMRVQQLQTISAAALPQSNNAQPGVNHKRQLQQLHHCQPVKRQKQGPASSNITVSIGPQLLQQHVTQNPATAQARAVMAKASIHPRNRYADKLPDFKLLSQTFPDLRPHVKLNQHGSASIDFRQPDACKALTKALLKHDFDITWDVPEGQLVPPVTNRANYIHWLEDLLVLSSPTGSKTIKGLDIGCGANCIYPLLGAALNGWHFVGTDIMDIAIEWAGKNVQDNPHLAHLIEIRRTGQSSQPLDSTNVEQGILLPAVHNGECFSFCMCNPPFFETLQEAGRNPHTAYAGNLCSPLSAAFTLCRQVTSLRLCLCVSQLCIHLCATLFVCPIERTLMKLMCFSVQHGTELIKQLQYNRQKCQLQLCMSAGRFNRITRRAAMRLCVTF